MVSEFVFGLVAKTSKPQALELARTTVIWLAQRGLSYVTTPEVLEHLGVVEKAPCRVVEREDLTNWCQAALVLGGDGTLLSVARHPADPPVPIIGVNLGTLGFLTEIGVEEIFDQMVQVMEGKAQTADMMLLEVHSSVLGRETFRGYALNDVVLTKDALARVLGVEIWVNGEFAALLKGDGLIIATPAGSTAYSLAAGGSIVHPGLDAMLVTPICPHSLTSRPLIITPNSEILLRVPEHSSATNDELFLTIDGQEGLHLPLGSEIKIGASKRRIRLVLSMRQTYFQKLGRKLKWGVH